MFHGFLDRQRTHAGIAPRARRPCSAARVGRAAEAAIARERSDRDAGRRSHRRPQVERDDQRVPAPPGQRSNFALATSPRSLERARSCASIWRRPRGQVSGECYARQSGPRNERPSPSESQVIVTGTEGGTRTHKPLRIADFESAASAIPPLRPDAGKVVHFGIDVQPRSGPGCVLLARRGSRRPARAGITTPGARGTRLAPTRARRARARFGARGRLGARLQRRGADWSGVFARRGRGLRRLGGVGHGGLGGSTPLTTSTFVPPITSGSTGLGAFGASVSAGAASFGLSRARSAGLGGLAVALAGLAVAGAAGASVAGRAAARGALVAPAEPRRRAGRRRARGSRWSGRGRRQPRSRRARWPPPLRRRASRKHP